MGIVRYGTSSWSEKSWVGSFYPEGMRPGDFLTYYASQFSTVEADVTYYRVPDRRLVAGWNEKTPEGFALAAKFPRSIVHCGEGRTPDASRLLAPEHVGEDTRQFLDAMRLLGDKRGPLVLQFPYFNREAFPGPRPFLERLASFLDRLPDDFRYAVEIRNKHWVKPRLLDLLRERNVALVLLDLNYMPHPDEYDLDLVTADFCYTRLIGDRKAVDDRTETFDRIVIDQSRRLARWAAVLERFMERVPLGWIYANNHFAGHGPATIRDLAGRLPEAIRG
jgi:uncharacterized protein YecE (DUF72 family)